MDEGVSPVRNANPPPEIDSRRPYEEERRRELDELDRRLEGPPEEGKGQYVDVLA